MRGEISRQGGGIAMLPENDRFYEGAYANKTSFMPRSERLWHVLPLWLINSGYVWTVRRYVSADSTVVELGCAGGVSYFGSRYRMIGCDLSFSSLEASDSYAARIQSDATECIPLADGSVDAIVSSYFWEHITPLDKPKILGDCRRILKPGGKLVFLYDVETENPLIRRFREKEPLLYKSLFVDGDSHLGYQTTVENISIFQKAGFRVLEHKGMEKTWIQSPSVYIKLSEFKNGESFRVLSRFGEGAIFYLWTSFTRLVDSLISPFLPASWARIDRIVLQKEVDP